MTLIVGIDEAGYGPNLGPLCVGATAWRVGGDETGDLYERLAAAVCPQPDGERIAIADSKRLYQRGSLRALEAGVLSALALLNRLPGDWRAVVDPPPLPWYADFQQSLPVDACADQIRLLADRLAQTCQAAQVELVELRTRQVFPAEFNQLCQQHGSKGAALSHVSLELLKKVLTAANSEPIQITCDKHGGRNRYAELLAHHFPTASIETLQESRPVSRYRWGAAHGLTEICFRSKGEAALPVALGSMAAKYSRELAMRAFNAFWTARVPGLKPTAGYPQDAKRFRTEIQRVESALGIDPLALWRNK